jgi:lipopolysaccharide/colanic/teichoic acid biosynthesis glycosyltransferase
MSLRKIGLLLKRMIDFAVSAVLLLLSAPLMLICAIIIKLDSRGPVFFRQERLGWHGKPFRVFKFRTMVQDAEKIGTITSVTDPRITAVGRVFRKFRMDEWPQLINVFLGEMSLIGPRPLVPLFAHTWTPEELRRLEMKPGMSGWQQINGAATNTWEERVALDLWYVDHWSLWLDLKIFLHTPLVVLGARTVYGKDGMELSSIPTQVRSEALAQVSQSRKLPREADAQPSSPEGGR